MIESKAPNERRGILHRRDSWSRRIASLLPVVGPVISMLPDIGTARPAAGKPCPVGFSGDGRGNCIPNPRATPALEVKAGPGFKALTERILPFGATGYVASPATRTEPSEAVMGVFGAGLIPGSQIIDRAICLYGMVLGKDGICYNRNQIRNSERAWPKGTRPLGTPGEMRALRIASRFAGRMDRTNVRLQTLGLLKKPTRSKPKQKLIAAKC